MSTQQHNNDKCSTKIEVVETYKYLGVYLDDHLKWKVHAQHLQNKLRQSAYALYHLGNSAPYHVLKQAYFSLVESHLRHGITAWGNAKCTRHIQTTQNRIVKLVYKKMDNQTHQIIHGNKEKSPKAIFKNMAILNINQLYTVTIVKEFMEDGGLAKKLDHKVNTRSKAEGKYNIPKYKNDYGKYSISVTLSTALNALPKEILNERDKRIKSKLMKQNYINK